MPGVTEPFVPAAYRPPVTEELAREAWAVARRLVELDATPAPDRQPAPRGPHRTPSHPQATTDGRPSLEKEEHDHG